MIEVWSDGSSTGRSNREGGWGFLVLKDSKYLAHGYGGSRSTTNNKMEMKGAIQGLWWCADNNLKGIPIVLVSDSQYVLGTASGIYVAKKNLELTEELQVLSKYLKIEIRWCKGHSGVRANEFVDKLAGRGKRKARKGLLKEV
jgi:ribonuclease HI